MTEEPKYTHTVTGLTELMCSIYNILSFRSIDGYIVFNETFLRAFEGLAEDVRKFDIENDR
jgi:hypothetical protein